MPAAALMTSSVYNGPTQNDHTRYAQARNIRAKATLEAFDAVIREIRENGISATNSNS